MTDEQIKELALANGFKLKLQPPAYNCAPPHYDLNPYVYQFARALLQAASAAPAQEGWISVEDRLPEEWRDYVVCADTDDGPEVLAMRFDPADKDWIYEGEPTFCLTYYVKPTHWMPLPTPPQLNKGEQ